LEIAGEIHLKSKKFSRLSQFPVAESERSASIFSGPQPKRQYVEVSTGRGLRGIAEFESMAQWIQFKLWMNLAFASFGGLGIFFSAFVDSSFVPLPLVSDLLLMEFSSRHPLRMPYYAAMAALGSLGGCIWIYWLARKGGQSYYRKTQGRVPCRIRTLIQEHPIASVFFPAVAPFPVPFKPFVIAQGVFQVPFGIFVVVTLSGRGVLFFLEGFLGARYGEAAKQFLLTQKLPSLIVVVALVLIFLIVRRTLILRRAQQPQAE
jgi:membrane protein YqaA with SNARE-associated domain